MLDHVPLDDPVAFYAAVARARDGGATLCELAASVRERGDVGELRAARLFAMADVWPKAIELASHAVHRRHLALRAHGLALLAIHEARPTELHAPLSAKRALGSARALEQILYALRASQDDSAFALEAELALLTTLAEIYERNAAYDLAQNWAGEAILLAKALGVPALEHHARVAYALAAFRAEALHEAQAAFETLLADPSLRPVQRRSARLNTALIAARFGDDDLALSLLDALAEDEPGVMAVEVTRLYVRALRGDPDETPVPHCPSGNYDALARALRRLALPDGAAGALAELHEFTPRSAMLHAHVRWLRGSAMLRAGTPLLALGQLDAPASGLPDVAAMRFALQIEVALHPDGEDAAPLPTLCRDLAAVFAALPSASARRGLARRLALWHPVGAAFAAFAPAAVPELVDAATGAVFRGGRPIEVYGVGVRTRVPFVQRTLAAFGLPHAVPRDQSTERERLALALRRPDGRWRAAVPPALLVFHLCRAAETGGGAWTRAGRALASSHGLVPTTDGNHLRDVRGALQDALQDLIGGQASPYEVVRALAPWRLGGST